MAEKLVQQSQAELVGIFTAVFGALAASGLVTMTPEQIGSIAAGLGVLFCLVRYWSDGAKLVLKKSKIVEDLEQGQFPCIEDVQADLGLASIEIDKIKAAAISLGLSSAQIEAFLKASGMNETDIRAVLVTLK